jgi:hypothetical protein
VVSRLDCTLDPPYRIKFSSNWQPSTKSPEIEEYSLEGVTREPEQIKAFRDTGKDGVHSYLTFWRDRLVVARELLAESDSIFVEISDTNLHLLRSPPQRSPKVNLAVESSPVLLSTWCRSRAMRRSAPASASLGASSLFEPSVTGDLQLVDQVCQRFRQPRRVLQVDGDSTAGAVLPECRCPAQIPIPAERHLQESAWARPGEPHLGIPRCIDRSFYMKRE